MSELMDVEVLQAILEFGKHNGEILQKLVTQRCF